jgi:nitrogen regulatory protein P-II 1
VRRQSAPRTANGLARRKDRAKPEWWQLSQSARRTLATALLDTRSARSVKCATGIRQFPPLPGTHVQLLIAVINHPEKLDEILSAFVELGITGATVVRSEGMGRVLSSEVPIFAGVAMLSQHSRPQNTTIFSVIREPEKVDRVIDLLREICGNLEDPATGIVFTTPVTRVVGLAPELGEGSRDTPSHAAGGEPGPGAT